MHTQLHPFEYGDAYNGDGIRCGFLSMKRPAYVTPRHRIARGRATV